MSRALEDRFLYKTPFCSLDKTPFFSMRPRGRPSISGIWLFLGEIVISIGESKIFFLLRSGCLGFDERGSRHKMVGNLLPLLLPVLSLVFLHLSPSLESLYGSLFFVWLLTSFIFSHSFSFFLCIVSSLFVAMTFL